MTLPADAERLLQLFYLIKNYNEPGPWKAMRSQDVMMAEVLGIDEERLLNARSVLVERGMIDRDA